MQQRGERLKPGMATSIHVRGNGVGSTLLRKKADPAHDWVDNLPAVAEGETVRVIETEPACSRRGRDSEGDRDRRRLLVGAARQR